MSPEPCYVCGLPASHTCTHEELPGITCGVALCPRHGTFTTRRGHRHVLIRPLVHPTCRVCGCSDEDCRGCISRTGDACHWVEHDLCSACVAPISTAAEKPADAAPPAAVDQAEATEPEEAAAETPITPSPDPVAGGQTDPPPCLPAAAMDDFLDDLFDQAVAAVAPETIAHLAGHVVTPSTIPPRWYVGRQFGSRVQLLAYGGAFEDLPCGPKAKEYLSHEAARSVAESCGPLVIAIPGPGVPGSGVAWLHLPTHVERIDRYKAPVPR
jgi:hypothetical protein